MEVSGQLRAPAAYPRGKGPQYPLDMRLDGPQSRSGRGASIAPGGNPVVQTVA
jgi:hypothetical protein